MKFLLATLLALASCTPVPPAPGFRPETHSEGVPGVVVRIHGPGTSIGTGAVVGPHTVATVQHVADLGQLTVGGKKARVVRTIVSKGWEEIVLLEVDWTWEDEQIFSYRSGGREDGLVIWNMRGPTSLVPSFVIPGDSGSPVLDDAGELVGHLSAVRAMGAFTQIGIGSFYPAGVQLNRIEVR